MSLEITYEPLYYLYESESFSITPTSLTGTPTDVTITQNNTTYVNSSTLAVDLSGVITGETKRIIGQAASGEVTLTVTATDGTDTVTATINIIVMFNLKFCKSFSTTALPEGEYVIYSYIQGTAVDELIVGYGYKTTYSGSGNAKPYLLGGLRHYFKNKTSDKLDNFGQKFYLKDYANEVGSCEYSLIIQGGPTGERKSLTQKVLVNVYPKPDLEYEKYDYTFFTNKNFEITPTKLIDEPCIKSISQRNNLEFDSSSCVLTGSYSEPITFSPYFNVQSIYDLTRTPTWNKKTFNINVVNPVLEYLPQDIFVNMNSVIEPSSNSTILNNSVFTITETTFGLDDEIQLENNGSLSANPTSLGQVTKTITLTTTDDSGNSETMTATAVMNVVPPTLNYDPVSTYKAEEVTINPIIGGNLTQFSVTSGTLPQGLELEPATGIIHGVINEIGSFTVEITGTDGTEVSTAIGSVTIESKDPSITKLIYDDISTSINKKINSVPEFDGYKITFSATSLPRGLSIDPETGVISGMTSVTDSTITVTGSSKINSISADVKITVGGLFIVLARNPK